VVSLLEPNPDGTPRWFGGGRLLQYSDPAPIARELGTRLWGGGAFRRILVHWAGTRRDLPPRGEASRHRGRSPAPLRRHRPGPRSGRSLGRG
jgi:hypothetical protein